MFDCNLFLFYFFHRKIVPAYEYIQACLLHLLDTEWQVRIQSTENLICYVTHKFLILCNLFCTTWTFDCKWLFCLFVWWCLTPLSTTFQLYHGSQFYLISINLVSNMMNWDFILLLGHFKLIFRNYSWSFQKIRPGY